MCGRDTGAVSDLIMMGNHGWENGMIKQDQAGEVKNFNSEKRKREKRKKNGIKGLVQRSRD